VQRRKILAGLASAMISAPLTRWSVAADRLATPSQARGPFYPKKFPDDKDFDLTTVAGRSGVAFGQIVTVSGQVTSLSGAVQSSALVEIWQVNGYGRYHHEGDDSDKPIDANFQGYAAVLTDAEGRFRFRTVKPVAYPGRAPHIHFILTPKSGRPLTTQMYIAGAPENDADFLLNGTRDKQLRNSLIVPLETVRGGGELAGQFDIVIPNVG
jgi:protocatechuate 3,4-dioxygenase, beta subunit